MQRYGNGDDNGHNLSRNGSNGHAQGAFGVDAETRHAGDVCGIALRLESFDQFLRGHVSTPL